VIQISRRLAKQLRSVLRQSIVEQSSPATWPLLHCQADGSLLTIQAQASGVAVRLQQPSSQSSGTIAFSSSVLKEFEARQDGMVTLETATDGTGQAKWQDGSCPHTLEFEAIPPQKAGKFPEPPSDFVVAKEGLLAALADAGEVTASIAARFALNRVVLGGQQGQIISSDGRQLLIQDAFSFPWRDNLLIPRVSAFGNKELQHIGKVQIGATDQHVCIQTGPWTFTLKIDKDARYPDVQTVIPKASSLGTHLHFAAEDIQPLLDKLSTLPGSAEDGWPITVDLKGAISIRAKAPDNDEIVEHVLAGSQHDGPHIRLCFNRNFLRRALQLGFREMSVGRSESPVVFSDNARRYLFIPFEPRVALPPPTSPSDAVKAEPKRRQPIVPASPNNPPPSNGHASNERVQTIEEILTETEALRTAWQDSLTRLSKIITGLKQHRKHSRVVKSVVQSLRQLQLNE